MHEDVVSRYRLRPLKPLSVNIGMFCIRCFAYLNVFMAIITILGMIINSISSNYIPEAHKIVFTFTFIVAVICFMVSYFCDWYDSGDIVVLRSGYLAYTTESSFWRTEFGLDDCTTEYAISDITAMFVIGSDIFVFGEIWKNGYFLPYHRVPYVVIHGYSETAHRNLLEDINTWCKKKG